MCAHVRVRGCVYKGAYVWGGGARDVTTVLNTLLFKNKTE